MQIQNRDLFHVLVVCGTAVVVACGGGETSPTASEDAGSPTSQETSPPTQVSELDRYTVSYRSLVRVPDDGAVMKHVAFIEQVGRLDPIAAKRCPVSNDAEFQVTSDTLGGITWTHPVAILKDQSQPPLYRGRIPPPRAYATPNAAGTSEDSARAPTIERPDLVGYQESTAIFLSQRHGLMAVKTDGAKPVLSCALKLPGQPKYFFYKGNEIILLINGNRVNQAALVRFAVTATGFNFLDSILLENQQIQDARLFDRTLVIYSNLYEPTKTVTPTPTTDSAAIGSKGVSAGAPIVSPYFSNPSLGVKVTAAKWDTALTTAWSEEFLNDRNDNDFFAGQDPATFISKLTVGDIVSTNKRYKSFISASDRYVVVSRDVNRTVFTGTKSQTYTYCTASHQGPSYTVTYCYPKYEQRKNPDYKDPQSTKGDYACNGKTLLDCIQEAAPTVSRYIYVRVGETCHTNTYSDTLCDRMETRTISYPTYRTDPATQFVVYRYVDGDFIKLDEQLFQMADPGKGASTVPTLSFTGQPLEVAGTIDSKGDLQFQHGHFYVLTKNGEQLHTLLIAGNSIAALGTQAIPRRTTGSSYSSAHSTLFSDNRMMVSRTYSVYPAQNGINTWSDVMMMDLTAASFPKPINQFAMPGSSEQLILAASGVLGPGQVSFSHANVQRNLQKITLFNSQDASEVDNVLLGTEFNADFVSSWLGSGDDQRIRLDGNSQRLFLPYSGYHHTPQEVFNPMAHRLNITAVSDGLTSEVTFDLAEDIIRTVSIDSTPNAGRALAFGNSSVYATNQGPQGWTLEVVEEFATPIAVYRIRDKGDVHARIDRIGTRCQISTFQGSAKAFNVQSLTAGPPIDCMETDFPMGVRLSVLYANSSAGWDLSPDGLSIVKLTAAEVKERLTHVSKNSYCAIDSTKEDGTAVPYLDEVPASIMCYPFPKTIVAPGTVME
jgi:hypothetical protein